MCGIFGYSTFENTISRSLLVSIISSGLESMQYRGYDSSGIYLKSETIDHCSKIIGNKSLLFDKINSDFISQGYAPMEKINFLNSENNSNFDSSVEEKAESFLGIAHNRWSTRGVPSFENAHPIPSDKNSQFHIVHNGTILNAAELKNQLISEGYTFSGETDTEVVVVYLLKVYNDMKSLGLNPSFKELVDEVLSKLDGQYAFIFVSKHFPGEMIATRNESPLILGIENKSDDNDIVFDSSNKIGRYKVEGNERLILASDPVAIVPFTRHLVYINNHEIIEIKPNGFNIFNMVIQNPIRYFKGAIDAAKIGKYRHFMEKEIYDQPESIKKTLEDRICFDTKRITLKKFNKIEKYLREARKFTFIGCGTSLNACEAVKMFFIEMTGKEIIVESATKYLDSIPELNSDQVPKIENFLNSTTRNLNQKIEFVDKYRYIENPSTRLFRKQEESDDFEDKENIMFFISQSGETKDTMDVLQYAKRKKQICVGISNAPSSQLKREAFVTLNVRAGPECSVASTKAYTCQIVNLMLIAMYISQCQQDEFLRSIEYVRDLSDEKKKIKENFEEIQKCRESIIDELATIEKKIEEVLSIDIDPYVNFLNTKKSMVVIGRGFQTSTCMETALKIKEVSYIHAEGIAGGELKHGPLAMVSTEDKIIAFVNEDKNYKDMLDTVEMISSKVDVDILIVSTKSDVVQNDKNKLVLTVPKTSDSLQTIINIIPMQKIAYYLSLERNINPDYPRHLAKSVTVN